MRARTTVALSVSISHSESPALTLSPNLTTHLAMLPSFMVGDNAGMGSSV
jgi:hypothetical protein